MADKTKSKVSGEKVSLEMTPMIDVVFQLLIFFIVALRVEDIQTNLDALRPAAPPEKPVDRTSEPVSVEVGRDGFVMNGARVTEAQLGVNLSRIAKTDPNSMIVIKCTGDSQHGLLVRTLDTCYSLGLRKLSVFSL